VKSSGWYDLPLQNDILTQLATVPPTARIQRFVIQVALSLVVSFEDWRDMDTVIKTKDCLLNVFKAHVSLASVKAFLDGLVASANRIRKAAPKHRRFDLSDKLLRVLSLLIELQASGKDWSVLARHCITYAQSDDCC
jgi:hypothetical protein